MAGPIRKWASRRQLASKMNDYMETLLHSRTNKDDVILIHRLKLDLEPEFEARTRSLQTLLELNHRPAITFALRELIRTSSQWPPRHASSHAQSEFLLRLLYRELPPDEWKNDV